MKKRAEKKNNTNAILIGIIVIVLIVALFLAFSGEKDVRLGDSATGMGESNTLSVVSVLAQGCPGNAENVKNGVGFVCDGKEVSSANIRALKDLSGLSDYEWKGVVDEAFGAEPAATQTPSDGGYYPSGSSSPSSGGYGGYS